MTTATLERELLELEKQYWRALKEKDVKEAMRLTDFPCIISGPQGIGSVDERTFEKLVTNSAYTIDRVELDEAAHVRLIRDDVAILAYKVHEELTLEGQRVALDASDSSTWIRRDNGRWCCALHTEAILGDPFGRQRQHSQISQGSTDDVGAIRGLIHNWLVASEAGDLSTIMSLMAEDVVFMVP